MVVGPSQCVKAYRQAGSWPISVCEGMRERSDVDISLNLKKT